MFWARFVLVPLWLAPSVHTAACMCVTVMTGSFYLAFFFFISHNFKVARSPSQGLAVAALLLVWSGLRGATAPCAES